MIGIIDYGAGNLFSVKNALDYLGVENCVTGDKEEIEKADELILPGVGAFPDAMNMLEKKGLTEVICREAQRKPLLGICLGMQLLCSRSEEGDVECLGIFGTQVRHFRSALRHGAGLKVPQVGWNSIGGLKTGLFSGVDDGAYMYFVHSYFAGICEDTVAVTEYGLQFSSALRRGNFMGCQFHPEKSGDAGERILANFLKLP